MLFVAVGRTNTDEAGVPILSRLFNFLHFAVGLTNADEATSSHPVYPICPDFECPNHDDEGGIFKVFFKYDV